MDLKLTPGRLHGAPIVALSIWFLHGFVHGVLAASVAAIASWPLYARFAARARKHVGKHVTCLRDLDRFGKGRARGASPQPLTGARLPTERTG